MSKVIYRSLIKEDYSAIKSLICEAFGFDKFIKDEKLLDIVLSLYFQECISESSFSKVAEKDNEVIGFILGKSEKDKYCLEENLNITKFSETDIGIILANKKNRQAIQEFAKIQEVYMELIKGIKNTFEGSIQLFIVSKESRGLGIGKSLLSYLFDYMKDNEVKSLYLYTDTRCNYGFYDSQGFKCLKEKDLHFESFDDSIIIFLYEYVL